MMENDVRLIDNTNGNYTRAVNENDLNFILACTRDWPNGRWSRPHAKNIIENSIDWNYDNPLDGTKSIIKLVVIFCLSDDTPVGFTSYSYYYRAEDGADSTSQTHYTAMHPDYRGQGKMSEFFEILTWSLLELSDVNLYAYQSIENSPSSEIWNYKAASRGSNKKPTKFGNLAPNPKTPIEETRDIIDRGKRGHTPGRFERIVL